MVAETTQTAPASSGIINPVIPEFGQGEGGPVLGSLIARLFRTAILVGGLALLVFIVMGGINWITAGGDEKKVEDAKNRITNGIVGMAILVGAAAIVSFISQAAFGFDILNMSLGN